MNRILRFIIGLTILNLIPYFSVAVEESKYEYKSPKEINKHILRLAETNKQNTEVKVLARTPGERDLLVLKIGEKDRENPAVLVAANMEGDYPISSEAAIRLAERLLDDWEQETVGLNWYIIPLGNPDGYANFFQKPLDEDYLNLKPYDDDKDSAFDEDGPEDLNGDGYITRMRQKHPEGRIVESSQYPLLMRIADNHKGEKGVYRIFTEGIDNDGDGKINEDGTGGVNPGHNYPHDFKHYTSTDGLWAASESESRGILEFAYGHPEITMIIVLGRTNTLKNLPKENKEPDASGGLYEVPERFAKRLGIDPDQKLPLKEITELFRELWDNPALSEDRVKRFLGGGALVNPDEKDKSYWEKISGDYNDFIKKCGLDDERTSPPDFSHGSFGEWAYYQYGVPTFCMDFWTPLVIKDEPEKELSLSLDDIRKMTVDEFLEVEDVIIDSVFNIYDIMKKINRQDLKTELESSKITPENIADALDESFKIGKDEKIDKTEEAVYLQNRGLFLEWKPFNHPTLGEVEIGGMVPHSEVLPPPEKVDELIDKQLPFITKLPDYLPHLKIEDFKIEETADDVWKVKVWIKNEGFLPYPTYQGYRCKRPIPAVIEIRILAAMQLLEGEKRVPLKILEGTDGTEEINWLIESKAGGKLTVDLISPSAGTDSKTIIMTEED